MILAQIEIPDFEMPVSSQEFIDGVQNFVAPEIQTFVLGMAAIAIFKSLMFGGK